MRWVRFEHNGQIRNGMLEGTTIRPIRGDPFGPHLVERTALELSEVRLDVPVIPKTFYAAGLNYRGHAAAISAAMGQAARTHAPDIGYRSISALIPDGQAIILPADASEQVHYEGELAVVIGKKAKNLDRSDALSAVFGYTIGNDVSERSWQRSDATFWRAKNTDTFKPMGPWIETAVSLETMETTVRLNGEEQIRFATAGMLYGIEDYLVRITRYVTLHPGDVIWMGTEGNSPNLKDGDVVEVEISGIGVLRNPVKRERISPDGQLVPGSAAS